MNDIPWIEKYRPKNISELTQNKSILDLFRKTIETKNMTHYIFYGPPGTGKTSAILALSKEIFGKYYNQRVIEFNASDDRGINAVRIQITNEAKKYVSDMDGSIPAFKIIVLDEADSMTDEAQDALRVIIEQYSNVTRFCFICNFITKITDAIKSRCSAIFFKKLSRDCMAEKLMNISQKENMTIDNNHITTIIDLSDGDMRKAIIMLQNLKYCYDFKKSFVIPFLQKPLALIRPGMPMFKNMTDSEIDDDDIYKIATFINNEKAQNIIIDVINCKSVKEVLLLSREIMSIGYPIDNIITQINKIMLSSDFFDDHQKALIINHSANIFYRLEESANEYIQLVDYLTNIYRVHCNIND